MGIPALPKVESSPRSHTRFPGPIKVFTMDNTEEVTDQKFLNLVDRVPYLLGKCFSVSKNLSILAKHSGFRLKPMWDGIFRCW